MVGHSAVARGGGGRAGVWVMRAAWAVPIAQVVRIVRGPCVDRAGCVGRVRSCETAQVVRVVCGHAPKAVSQTLPRCQKIDV